MATAKTPSLVTLHRLLAVQSVVVILVSINRLSSLTLGYVLPNEFLRWVDFNNMLILPLISTVAFYLLKKHIEYDSPALNGRWHWALNLVFIVAIYLIAASYGDHEVTNYLHARFCPNDEATDLCRIVIFNDDEFSHWVFFAGFILMNAAVMLLQVVFPHRGSLGRSDWAWLVLNGLFIGAGIFANLAFEVIGLDLYIVAAIAALALYLFWQARSQPLLIYYSAAYVIGLVATFIYKITWG